MTNVYVHSGYERKENDDYQTIDSRCVRALTETLEIPKGGSFPWRIVDICGSHGSGIVKHLTEAGYKAEALEDAFSLKPCQYDTIVTNPPYDRKIVDRIANFAIDQVEKGNVKSACFLMRANWDFAISRSHMFDNDLYYGQIRMRFRPWWTEERTAQPIHNYVWHLWGEKADQSNNPQIFYWPKSKKPIA